MENEIAKVMIVKELLEKSRYTGAQLAEELINRGFNSSEREIKHLAENHTICSDNNGYYNPTKWEDVERALSGYKSRLIAIAKRIRSTKRKYYYLNKKEGELF